MTPELVSRLRAGDQNAGRVLDKLYRAAIIRFCTGYLVRVEEAEDATQEVFCRVLAANEVPGNFRAYLYKAARNHCLNVIRNDRLRNRVLSSSSQLPPDSQTGHLTRLLKQEQHSRLTHLVESLTDDQSESLILRYREGLSRLEIAEVLDTTESVIKSRLYEGLKKLREHPSLLTHL